MYKITHTKTQQEMIADLDMEIYRVKQFLNENGYHSCTAVNHIAVAYRGELKKLRMQLCDNMREGVDLVMITEINRRT